MRSYFDCGSRTGRSVSAGRITRSISGTERQLLEFAPEDGEAIRELTGLVRRASKLTMPVEKPEEPYTVIDMVRIDHRRRAPAGVLH